MTDLMKPTETLARCKRGLLLSWLDEVLANADEVDVEIVVEQAGSRSSVQITLRDVPGPLAGLEIRKRA